jgi:hypothetical protein
VCNVARSSPLTACAQKGGHGLPDAVVKLVTSICDVKAMSAYMAEMDIDTKRVRYALCDDECLT